jgi:hypothetical protein
MPEVAMSGRDGSVCANLMDPSDYDDSHNAGGQQNPHYPQPRGPFPERTLHAPVTRHLRWFW